MNGLLNLFIRILVAPLAAFLVALAAPFLRGQFLDRNMIAAVIAHLSTLYKGLTPTYADVGTYLAEDVEDVVTNLKTLLDAGLTHFGIVLTNANMDRLLVALGERYAVKYPAPPAEPQS